MRLFLWFRCLLDFNWYENPYTPMGAVEVVILDLDKHEEFNVHQTLRITSVNRTTGKLTGEWI